MLVGRFDQPLVMGRDHDQTPFGHLDQDLPNKLRRRRVKFSRRLIREDHAAGNQAASDPDAQALSARQIGAVLVNTGIKAARQQCFIEKADAFGRAAEPGPISAAAVPGDRIRQRSRRNVSVGRYPDAAGPHDLRQSRDAA